ncbi:MAG: hypothetical protein IKP58_09360 [Victivallales bacterium]|nr:hypothetical protein [Victivallales bacterium]
MSFSNLTEKHVGTIALIVAIIALFGTLIPQITDFVAKNSALNAPTAPEAPLPSGPAGGPEGPGGGRPGPGGPGMGGPGGPGMGGPRGGGFGGFGPMKPSDEYIAKYKERVALYDEALKTAQGGEALKLRLDRDLAQLMLIRNENGGRRIMPGLAEAFLKERYATASETMSKLDKNQAELDYIQALDRMRGDKDAFLNTIEPMKSYPKTALTQEQLVALLAAEQPVGQP